MGEALWSARPNLSQFRWNHLVDVAPDPGFSRLDGPDQRVSGAAEVSCGVHRLVRGVAGTATMRDFGESRSIAVIEEMVDAGCARVNQQGLPGVYGAICGIRLTTALAGAAGGPPGGVSVPTRIA
jgi:hypothetical protein